MSRGGPLKRMIGAAKGNIRIRLLDGRRLTGNLNGPPPSILKIAVPPEDKPVPGTKPPPGREAICRRVDLEEYVEMGVEDLRKAGPLKGPDKMGKELDKQPTPLI